MLALGIGANTAIFSIVDGVLLRTLPYREPSRLVSLREIIPAVAAMYPTLPVSARHFMDWRQRCSSFASLSAISIGTSSLTGVGEPERLQAARVSADFFDTLGVQPRLGRGFAPGEDAEGRDHVVVITDSLWRRRFQADAGIVGKTILLDSVPHTIIGVLPAWFRFPAAAVLDSGPALPEKPEAIRPILFSKDELKELMGNFNYNVVARLKNGIGREGALAELNVIAAQLEKAAGETVNLRASATPLQESLVGKSRRSLIMLLAAVAAVMLIVCVNLANLVLARAERRGHDWAIRTALGASRARLVRQVLTETCLIALLGGIVGVALAAGSLGALLRHAPADIPRLDEVRLDLRVLLFALGMTASTGLLFGFAPAWRCARIDPQAALKAGGRALTGGREGTRFCNVLITAEVGLSTVLLVLAGLLGSSFLRVMRAEKGFRAPTVLAADVAIPWTKYEQPEQRNRFHERVLDHLRSQPGVISAAISSALPLTGETWVDAAWVPGDTRPPVERPIANVRFVSDDYLKTMGIPLFAGRTFHENDRKRKVAILSEQLAKQLWPGQDPVGRQFTRGDEQLYEVIGVAGDVRADPDKPPVAMIYRPYWDWPPRQVMLVARAAGDPRSIAATIRAAIRSVDPDVPIPEMHTMQEILEDSVAQRRFQMLLSAAFAATALLLAALGIYGVVSYAVARRTNEMGVRKALGARPWDLSRMVLGQALTPVAAGLALGIASALAAGRLVGSLLYEVSTRDPLIVAVVAGLLAAVAVAACWIPTRRATKVDPMEALRYE
jgi:putative ABC transport system permease protein